jgi:hypothetical protein
MTLTDPIPPSLLSAPHRVDPQGAFPKSVLAEARAKTERTQAVIDQAGEDKHRNRRNWVRLGVVGLILLLLEIGSLCTVIIVKENGAHAQVVKLLNSHSGEITHLTLIANQQTVVIAQLKAEVVTDRQLLQTVDAVASPSNLAKERAAAAASAALQESCSEIHSNQNYESIHGEHVDATPRGCPDVPIVKPPPGTKPG